MTANEFRTAPVLTL